jgi:hypothetical protein
MTGKYGAAKKEQGETGRNATSPNGSPRWGWSACFCASSGESQAGWTPKPVNWAKTRLNCVKS